MYRLKKDINANYSNVMVVRFGIPFFLKFSRLKRPLYFAIKDAGFKFNWKPKFKYGKEYGTLVIDCRAFDIPYDIERYIITQLENFEGYKRHADIIAICHPKIRDHHNYDTAPQYLSLPAFTPVYLREDCLNYAQECMISEMGNFKMVDDFF